MKSIARFCAMLLLVTGLAQTAWATSDFKRFFGEYEGEATVEIDGEPVRRDLGVVIREIKGGFRVNWQTTTVRPDGRERTKSYTIDFSHTGRANVYSSAMKTNLFGGREPLDPMKGDPYVWAHINDDTLTVHALIINEEGGYEMQTYDRTLVDEGLALRFTLIRDGQPGREINTVLRRTSD
jgi:hypothetical protein